MKIRSLLTSAMMGVVALSSACTTDDDIVFVTINGYLDPLQQCKISNLYLPKGTIDLSEDYVDSLGNLNPSPMTYTPNFIVKTTTKEKISETHPSLPNYGNVDTNHFIFEEAEISYDFSFAALPPSQATLDTIPQRIARPVSAYLNQLVKPGASAIIAATIVQVDLMGRAIGEQIGGDFDIASLMASPNTYPLVINTRLRGQTTAGVRFQTRDFSYPVDVCVGCTANCASTGDCYPPWQDKYCL